MMRVMLRIGTHGPAPACALRSPHPPHRTRQLGIRFGWIPGSSCRLKYSNSATELLGDSVAQFVRPWQAISQVVSSSPALSLSFFLGTRPICRVSFICSALLAARRGAGDKTCMDFLVTIADVKLRP